MVDKSGNINSKYDLSTRWGSTIDQYNYFRQNIVPSKNLTSEVFIITVSSEEC